MERAQLDRVAALARLGLEAEERERLARDCRAILEHFETIRAADAEAAAAAEAAEAEPAARWREDRPGSDPLERPPAEFAPDWREGFFVLPRLPFMGRRAGDEAGRGPDPG